MSDKELYSSENDSFSEKSDAQILWDDVCELLEGQLPEPTLAMFRSCEGISIDGDEFIIGISSGFVQRNIERNQTLILQTIERIAFQEMKLGYKSLNKPSKPATSTTQNATTISYEEIKQQYSQPIVQNTQETTFLSFKHESTNKISNPLVEEISYQDALLTFENFVEGDENQIAFQAAKNVANGSHAYNPLFIYGSSGLGKTHLLKAIQNYIRKNDSNRQCVYRQGSEFVRDYTSAMQNPDKSVRDALGQNYRDVDVLIIDDIQNIKNAAQTVNFFFETFNDLMRQGKQIILAADETPSQIGFEERVSSRLDSGYTVAIEAPNYELKLNLIHFFYKQLKEEANRDNIKALSGILSEQDLEYMASKAGSNIRITKSFCNSCLLAATRKQERGEIFTQEDINREAINKWGLNQRTFTVEQIQRFIEQRYGIRHEDLISNKRNKDLMEPRHVGVWLARDLTEATLAQIGDKFGGRTHATVKHSIKWVEVKRKDDRLFFDKTQSLRETLLSNA